MYTQTQLAYMLRNPVGLVREAYQRWLQDTNKTWNLCFRLGIGIFLTNGISSLRPLELQMYYHTNADFAAEGQYIYKSY